MKLKSRKKKRGGGGAEDLNLLNAELKADKAKLEHKVIELMAERQLLEDSISIPKDAMIRRLERQLQEKENEIKILKEQKSTYTKQLETNKETIEEYKTKVSLLVSTLSDKDMLVNTLQSLLEPDEAPTHQSLSYPRKTSLDTLNERGGGTGPGDITPVGPIRKTVPQSVSYKKQEEKEESSLPTYDQHMLGVIGHM
ncbi:PREDICTED: centrosomal protein of 290 kDa-like [Amphimedon queenslandica]|uniref:Uncharacterized protein n=1 Tax=Amphimedon queenslandica TaxID=400682 RepID=A0A1X7TNJ4_AMPQE|nr:PREDICTED: centrosomal protein of 290 kDa-like [Amphimedon queenslandica]|eukprot:XP_019858711.1 PREDICTED: centrosomal protein of 290 kDa-like [Amphimedon queenslandica]